MPSNCTAYEACTSAHCTISPNRPAVGLASRAGRAAEVGPEVVRGAVGIVEPEPVHATGGASNRHYRAGRSRAGPCAWLICGRPRHIEVGGVVVRPMLPGVPVVVRAVLGSVSAARKVGCRSREWLATKSRITRRPRWCAASINAWRSSSVPSRGSTCSSRWHRSRGAMGWRRWAQPDAGRRPGRRCGQAAPSRRHNVPPQMPPRSVVCCQSGHGPDQAVHEYLVDDRLAAPSTAARRYPHGRRRCAAARVTGRGGRQRLAG